MTPDGLEIADLRDVPEHFGAVADRLWRAWWDHLSDVEAALQEVVDAEGFPFTLVAISDGRFVGTVTGIQSDIDERPEVGPCLAALWVEPEARGQGVAERLVAAVLDRLSARGFERVYLSAKPHLHGFYQPRGWTLVEDEVGVDRLGIFVRALP